MKIRLLAALLLMASLLGTFGCAGASAPEDAAATVQSEENKNFISADRSEVLAATEQTGQLINFGAKNEEGEALYQIVYNIDSSDRVKDQCALLAEAIRDTTGVSVPVIHSAQSTKNVYELMIGNVTRVETLDLTDGFKKTLGENDFVVRVVGTRVMVYATNDQSLMAAMLFFMEQLVQKNSQTGVYGIAEDTDYTYKHKNTPPVEILGADDKKEYLEFRLETGLEMYTYVRVSYTGHHGWRLQTKYRAEQEYKDDGASQILAYSMGEYELGTDDERFYREPFSMYETDSYCELTGPDKSRLVIDKKSFRLDFYSPKTDTKPNGKLVNTITNITHYAGGSTLTGLFRDASEAVYGTGERMNGANQRGKQIEMYTKDIWSEWNACYMVIPLLCFSGGSGVFVNSYESMMMKLGVPGDNKDKWIVSMAGSGLDFYVFATEQMSDVLVGYSELSGYADLPEEWTYGMLVCAYGPDLSRAWSKDITKESQFGRGEGIYDMIAKMEQYDLPWTGVLAEGYGIVYSYQKYDELKELCTYVHSLGKKFLVYMRVGYATTNMKGFDTGYWLAQTLPDGTRNTRLPATTAEVTNPDFGTGSGGLDYLDITNPEAADWLFNDYWNTIINELGADGCKIDFCELLPDNYTLDFYDKNIPTAGAHHWYPTAFCTMFWDLVSAKPDSGMCYTRGGGIGAQRAPYMWAGDQKRYWDGIRYQLSAVLSSGLSGVPYMSYDMSGYQYGKAEDGYQEVEYEAEVFVRGTQFTAFTICMQTHGKVLRAYQFMGLEMPKFDKNGNVIYVRDENGEIVLDKYGNPTYEYEDEPRVPEGEYAYVTEIYRAYTKLHEHLTPYITELSVEASETAMPVMRHLALLWQNDSTVYNINDQYMFGDAFMVAPILSPLGKAEAKERQVYLPKLENGEKWLDLNDPTKEYAGGQWITVSANIKQLPTFYNTGSTSSVAKDLVDGIIEIYEYANAIEVPAKKS